MFKIVPRSYLFTVTDEPDTDYLKYLGRKLDAHSRHDPVIRQDATRLDISLDDPDGDVVAGIAAWTRDDTLVIDLLWVDEPLRGQGIGRRLIRMAEIHALERGCTAARVEYAPGVEFYEKLGYTVSARLVQFPSGSTFYRLHKALGQPVTTGGEGRDGADFELYPKIAL